MPPPAARPAAPRKIDPRLKMALEFGPLLAFFLGYLWLKDDSVVIGGREYQGFIIVTAAFLPVIVATTLALWRLTGRLARMQVATLVLVVVFGGLSVWLNDERFFKMKPTMIYALFAAILGAGLLRGRSTLRFVMEEAVPLRPEGWMILTRRVFWLFAALAVLNELVWRTTSTETWVSFKTFGLTLAVFGFFLTQGKLLETYGVKEEERP